MEQKQKYPMEVVIKVLRCCGQKSGCTPECPLFNQAIDDCNAIDLQAADMLEIMSAVLKTKEFYY